MEKYQVGGTHYIQHSIQPWDIVVEYQLDYFLGCALKYILRIKGVGRNKRIEDIQKSIHYLEKYISIIQIQNDTDNTEVNKLNEESNNSVLDTEQEQNDIYQGYADSFFGV